MKIETLRWRGRRLEMIDQRILPSAFEYVSYNSAEGVAEGIRSMVVRGAPAIGVAAAYGVALEALRMQHASRIDFNTAMNKGFDLLAASRPTAVNLFWALDRMLRVWQACEQSTPRQIAQRLQIGRASCRERV